MIYNVYMELHIASLLPNLEISDLRPKIRNQRQYVLSLFVEQLNASRGNLKPLSPSFIALKLSHLTVDELYFFFSKCEKASCGFSPCWWSELKTDKASVDRRLAFKNKYRV